MPNPSVPLIEAIQRRVAVVAITASTVRGQGAPGIVMAVCEFLSHLPLQPLSRLLQFRRVLDSETNELVRALPKNAKSRGLARKMLKHVHELRSEGMGKLKIARELGVGTSVVRRELGR